MVHLISVETPFQETSELIGVLATRGEGGSLVLPHTEHVNTGEAIEFSVFLEDGTVALSGTGQCVASHPSEEGEYYDVLVDAVHAAPGHEDLYMQVLQARGVSFGTTQTSIEAPAFHADTHHEGDDISGPSITPIDDASAYTHIDSEPASTDPNSAEFVMSASESPAEIDDGRFRLRRPSMRRKASNSSAEELGSLPPSDGLFVYAAPGLPYPKLPPRPAVSRQHSLHPAASPGMTPDIHMDPASRTAFTVQSTGELDIMESAISIHPLESEKP